MTDDGGNDKALSAALLRALETALHNTEANADRTAGAAAGASRRAQAGDAVLLALSAWLQSDAAHADDMRGDRSARRDQLRGALDALLSSNSSATQPGQRTREPEPAPAVRQSHATEAPDADYIPPAGVSPQLAQKLAAKLAAVAAAREAPEHGSTPTFNDATDPPTESQAVRPPTPAASSAHEVPSTRPTVVGDRYELITRVHQGGHTSVWRGIDTHARIGESAVAIKLIAEQHADALDEATLAALVDVSGDPGLMTLHTAGEQNGWLYQVSEWIDGQTLESLLRSRADAMSFLADLPEWMRQLARALEALHDAGFVHGDLKPANVMISRDHTAKLIDFDTVCRVGSTAVLRSLTPAFASPERRAGQPADTRDDVYSIAVIAYRLFTGELPHSEEDRRSVGQLQSALPRPDGLDTAQWQALRRGLAADRAQRTASVSELVNEIWETGRPNASEPVRRRRSAPPPRRSGGRRALAAAAVLTLAIAAVLTYPQVLGPDYGPSVLELRDRLWPGAARVQPVPAQPSASADASFTIAERAAGEAGVSDERGSDERGSDAPVAQAPVADVPLSDPALSEGPSSDESLQFDGTRSDEPAPDFPVAETPVTGIATPESLPDDPAPSGDAGASDAVMVEPAITEPESTEPAIAEPPPGVPAPVGSSTPPPQVSFTAARLQVPWNAPAAMVQVRRTGSLDEPASIRFQIEAGLAEPDEDFIVPADSRVEFRQGEDAALIVIPLVQRTDTRGTRSLWVTLIGDNIDPEGISEIQVVLMNDV